MKVAMDHNDTSTFATIGREIDALFLHLEIAGLPEDAASLRRYPRASPWHFKTIQASLDLNPGVLATVRI